MEISLNCYPNGKKRAFTLSYDDGPFADYRLVELMNQYKVRGTFHLNSGTLDSEGNPRSDRVKETDVATLYQGHEVSAHTFTHPDLRYETVDELRRQVLDDREKLEKLTGAMVRGMSYPFGTYNETVLTALPLFGIEYSRTTQAHQTMALPENFLCWHPTCHHKQALACVDAFENPRWTKTPLFYVWGHSYEFDNDKNWDEMEELLKRVSGKEDVWYATNIELADYIRAVRGLKFSTDGTMAFNPSNQSVWIEVDGTPVELKAGYNRL